MWELRVTKESNENQVFWGVKEKRKKKSWLLRLKAIFFCSGVGIDLFNTCQTLKY